MGDSVTPPTNGIRDRFDADDPALGVLETAYSPTLVELFGDCGLDFVWLDLEHGGPSPWDATGLEGLLRAAERTDTELLVRLPTTDPGAVRKTLDAGVRNVFLPRVREASEVRRAVEAGRFHYEGGPGERGLANPRASRWGAVDDYPTVEDETTLVGVTVETAAAVENINDICAVPDLGFVFVGPFDLSVSLGHPGEIDHPEVQAAIETVRDHALDAGVPLAGLGFGMDDVNAKVEQGYRLLNLGSTTGVLRSTARGWLDAFEGDRSR